MYVLHIHVLSLSKTWEKQKKHIESAAYKYDIIIGGFLRHDDFAGWRYRANLDTLKTRQISSVLT